MNNIIVDISNLYSRLGNLAVNGDLKALLHLYTEAWLEDPALIQTINQLHQRLSLVEIHNGANGMYSDEFLYYYGMSCLGEQSSLICKNLRTAKYCFDRIKNTVLHVEARIAYIELLCSGEPASCENNAQRIDIIRRWANNGDLFSKIILAKICFYVFLSEWYSDDNEPCFDPTIQSESSNRSTNYVQLVECSPNPIGLPALMLNILEVPCKDLHPVAVNLRNEIFDLLGATSISYENTKCSRALYDYSVKPSANMQILE